MQRRPGSRLRSQVAVGTLPLGPSDAAGELDVPDHECDAPGVQGAEVGVFEEVHEVLLRRRLQRLEAVGCQRNSSPGRAKWSWQICFTSRAKGNFRSNRSVERW